MNIQRDKLKTIRRICKWLYSTVSECKERAKKYISGTQQNHMNGAWPTKLFFAISLRHVFCLQWIYYTGVEIPSRNFLFCFKMWYCVEITWNPSSVTSIAWNYPDKWISADTEAKVWYGRFSWKLPVKIYMMSICTTFDTNTPTFHDTTKVSDVTGKRPL